ncbi:MAG: hypothetical protein AABX34_02250 [Nanoarchaeota archaeon]
MAELKPRISTGITESSIPTSHYYGLDHTGTTLDLYAGNPGRSSLGFTFAPSFVFNNNSGAQTWTALTRHSVHAAQLDGYYLINSSNKVIAIPIADWERYGPNVAANRDDLGENFAGWLAATEGSHAIEYAKSPEFRLFITERNEHIADPVLNKYVTDIGYAGHLNDLGKYLSKAETLRQDWKRYLASKEGQELAMQKSSIDGVEYLAVQPVEGVIYAVGRANDGKIILFRGDKSHDALARTAEFSRVSLEDIIKVGLGEEAMHIARKSFDNVGTVQRLIDEETATKIELLKFYESLADGAGSKPELRALYGKIIRHLEHDIATTEQRYRHFAEQQLGGNGLVQKLVAEAYASGLETIEEISNYVVAKVRETSKASKDTEGKNESRGSTSAKVDSESSEEVQKSADDGANNDAESPAQGSEGSPAQESGESAHSSE